MGKSEESQISKREMILKKSMGDFLKGGYSGVNMDSIASELGMSKTTIYREFKNKDFLIKELVTGYEQELEDELKLALAGDGSFSEILNELLKIARNRFSFYDKYILADLRKNAPEILHFIEEIRNVKLPSLISDLLKKGKKEKVVRKEIQIEMVSVAILSLWQELNKFQFIERFQMNPEKNVEFISDLVLNGILEPQKSDRKI